MLQPGARRSLADGLGIVALVLALGGGALACAWPWLAGRAAGGTPARYAPLRDGDAALFAKHDATGAVRAWESQNTVVVPPSGVFTGQVSQSAATVITEFARRPGEAEIPPDQVAGRLAGLEIVEVRSRELDLTGEVTDASAVFVRDGRGTFLVGSFGPTGERDVVFDPPLQVLPAGLEPGLTWDGEGRLSSPSATTYSVRGRVVEAGRPESRVGELDGCVLVEAERAFVQAGRVTDSTAVRDWYCADLGTVDSRELRSDGSLVSRSVLVGTERRADSASLPPPARPSTNAQAAAELGDPAEWTLTRLGRARGTGVATKSTIPPVWIPSDPPALLVAGHGGDLVALNAGDPAGDVLWRFRPGGNVHGPPAFDPERGRIYFGATDKRLYALDSRGMFLWSFSTGDNVATRPLVVGDTVVFGSEDRGVYGLDAADGSLRWTAPTGGAVVSSPALVGGLVVIGSDDGAAYGLDPLTGERRWTYSAGGAIEAPVVAADEVAYVVSRGSSVRGGTVAALDPTTGEPIWEVALPEKRSARTAPAVDDERVFVVDDYGRLTVLDRGDGRRLLVTVEQVYVGPPVVVDGALVVAGKDGNVYRLGPDGAVRDRWSSAAARSIADGFFEQSFQLGPTLGGGAVWLADSETVVRRLGPPLAGPARPAATWSHSGSTPPFGGPFITPPAEYGGRAVVVDGGNALSLLDPATGQAARLGRLGDGPTPSLIEPVVAGDLVLAVVGDTLHATSLLDGRPRWRAANGGLTYRPVAVAGDTVLWLQQAPPGATAAADGTLSALDLADGAIRWQAPLDGFAAAGGVIVAGATAYTSTPPAAFDVRTGRQVWRIDGPERGIGGPALSEDGDVLFVGIVSPTEGGRLVAIGTADGRERWRTSLDGEILRGFERPWPSGGIVIVPTFSGRMVAIDAATGAERWRYRPPRRRFGGITVAEGRVWLVLEDAQLLALDAASGEPVSRSNDLDQTLGAGLVQRPLVVGDRVVLPLGYNLVGFVLP